MLHFFTYGPNVRHVTCKYVCWFNICTFILLLYVHCLYKCIVLTIIIDVLNPYVLHLAGKLLRLSNKWKRRKINVHTDEIYCANLKCLISSLYICCEESGEHQELHVAIYRIVLIFLFTHYISKVSILKAKKISQWNINFMLQETSTVHNL